ncbi:MAG: hypothetical protein JYX80_06560 [Candidatus Scalindua sediminis]|nr:hypothetical protein [Candidatus Scalindua sediminis]
MLTVDRFKRLEDIGLGSIRVSIYGDTPESYDAVHGTKSTDLFRKIKDNLTKIYKIKDHTKLLITYNVVDG